MTWIWTSSLVAGARYNRWWVVVAALLINLSVGSAYAFSVFNLPLTRIRGITESAPGDWTLSQLGWIFTLAYVFLGLSAGVAGRWQDRVGPRVSGIVAACSFGAGLAITALGITLHRIELLYLGYGVLGGIGLGLGFNTPIATVLRWFPDRRGLATGMGIMGFGAGAIIAAPLAQWLMTRFASPQSVGVAETFLVLAPLYLAMMLTGAFLFRLPPADWTPPRSVRAASEPTTSLSLDDALHTRQLYLLWAVLLLNVTAGIGVLGQAAAMIQEVFNGLSATAAAAFVAVLSFFNAGGRLLWAAVSDRIGRRATYLVFFTVGPLMYVAVPLSARADNLVLFVACFAVIMTMYGGGFAVMPSYCAETFGPRDIGAIHGRVLTALSVAGVLGPVAINYLREYQIAHGVDRSEAYDITMLLMAALLVIGFFCNLAVRPVVRTSPVSVPEPLATVMTRPETT